MTYDQWKTRSPDDDVIDPDDFEDHDPEACPCNKRGHHWVEQTDFEGREPLVYCEWCGQGET